MVLILGRNNIENINLGDYFGQQLELKWIKIELELQWNELKKHKKRGDTQLTLQIQILVIKSL